MKASELFQRLVFIACLVCTTACEARGDTRWVDTMEDGNTLVHLYFFWSQRCPHCLEAQPFVQSLAQEYPWLAVHSHQLINNQDNVALYTDMARAMGQEARFVPAFFVCGQMRTGYDSAAGMGREILSLAQRCYQSGSTSSGTTQALEEGWGARGGSATDSIQVPLLGEVAPEDLSLPLFTLIVAGLDAFNPCAFFVLLFLMSLMVHARSRGRMLLIGGTFVLFSGLIYFLFMAAWLNLFLVVGGAPIVTLIAGLLAVIIGLLNTKDYFWLKRGPHLAIPESAKPGLFRRMRTLLGTDNTMAMLVGTATLAIAANSYELLCTAGFPMVYTRTLTLSNLDKLQYYAYLIVYNLIYVLPLLAIVGLFCWTLGTRKLSERQGRLLKLISGLMMLGLGLILLIAPEMLSQLWVGVGLLIGALVIGLSLTLVEKQRSRAHQD
jgi:thiol-disulfide isomerase/thioredoxin